jgi:hypothetical protein
MKMKISEVQVGDLMITTDFLEADLQLVLRVDHQKDIIDVFTPRLGRVEHYRSSWFRGCEKVCGST